MIYVLMLTWKLAVSASSASSITQEFATLDACNQAAAGFSESIRKNFQTVFRVDIAFVCTPKG